MPPQTSPKNIAFVIFCITFLATLFSISGAFLLFKGFQSGELLVGGALTAAGTLGALLSSTRTTPATNGGATTTQTSTTTTSSQSPPLVVQPNQPSTPGGN